MPYSILISKENLANSDKKWTLTKIIPTKITFMDLK